MDCGSGAYYAHSANAIGEWQSLYRHASGVEGLAVTFAEALGREDEARCAGLLHDIGKYGDPFQRRLAGSESGLDHWSLGAYVALRYLRSVQCALAIQGHHIGLQAADKDSLRGLDPSRLAVQHPLGLRLTDDDPGRIIRRMEADGLRIPQPGTGSAAQALYTAGGMLDVRMLYSTLVDADFLDTEAHMKAGVPGYPRPAGPPLNAECAYARVQAHIEAVSSGSSASDTVKRLREDLLNACIGAAQNPPGVYTLTAPTGAGKTLAMLAFALRHAMVHPGFRRIVIVIPYLSIIEQTARIYNEILRGELGANYVLEHHSMADMGRGRHAREDDLPSEQKLLSENWDAPIVITTSVQILESMFSNRPSACRKLHRLAGSIVLCDEVQTIPSHLTTCTLAALSHLSARYGSTVVFSTATQPAFTALDSRVRELNAGTTGWQPAEIVGDGLRLFERARKVEVRWPKSDERTSWPDLAKDLAVQDQAICIVNLKRHARELFEILREADATGLFHMSTSMCPAHRADVLSSVRELLRTKSACRLVSTQCLEAGVDLDAPQVYRAFADLVSIAQAAGRCDREGRRGTGVVTVFRPLDETYPDPTYKQAAAITDSMLKENGGSLDIGDPDVYRRYYEKLYALANVCDSTEAKGLREAITLRADFPAVACLYRIIRSDTINVLVPYKRMLDEFEALSEEARTVGLTSDWVRRARKLSVSVYRPGTDSPLTDRIEPVRVGRREKSRDWFIHSYSRYGDDGYDENLGLVSSDQMVQIG